MSKFYFTYGSEGHPFVGGWTEVEAPDLGTACATFRAFHPDKTACLLGGRLQAHLHVWPGGQLWLPLPRNHHPAA